VFFDSYGFAAPNTIGGNLSLTQGNGAGNLVSINDTTVSGHTQIGVGNGNDNVGIESGFADGVGVTFSRNVSIAFGTGSDTLNIGTNGDPVVFAANASFSAGSPGNTYGQGPSVSFAPGQHADQAVPGRHGRIEREDHAGSRRRHEICNTVSLQNYEGAEGAGGLVFVRPDHPAVTVAVKLRSPVPIQSHGAIRKLLQMASGKLCLFCDSRDVYGMGTIGGYDGKSEDLFEVRFLKRFTWELVHAGHVMMHCRDGKPQRRPPGPAPEPIRDALQRVFPGKMVDRLG
jgi:hypothetical protein